MKALSNRSAQTLLREFFQTGGLIAGEIVDPVDLAGVLRLPVDDMLRAVANLEAFGLLERLDGSRRYRVRRPAPDELLRFMRMRIDIETRVASTLALAAEQSDMSSEIATLRTALLLQREIAEQDERVRFLEESAHFHQLLAKTANFLHGARVLRTWEDYQQIVGMRALERPEAMMQAVDEHAALLDFVEDGDADAAAEAMRHHLDRTLQRMEAAVAS